MQANVRQQVLIDAMVPSFGISSRANSLIRDAVLVSGFTIVMILCAQLAIKIPTTTVPITGQTFGALLAGGALGSRRGALSMLIYMTIGMIGFPVFAPSPSPLGDGGVVHFILPWSGSEGLLWSMASGGYILGFVFATYLIGLLAERGWDRKANVLFTMVLGNAVIYLFGLPWLAVHIATNDGLYSFFQSQGGENVLDMTLRGGLYPFMGGDAIKLMAAAMILPGAWALVKRIKNNPAED